MRPSMPAVLAAARADRPTLAAWRRITAALDDAPDDHLPADLAAVAAACATWPDAVRRAPGRWLRDRIDGRPQPRLTVTRAVDLSLQGDLAGDRHAWADAPELAATTILRVFDDRLSDDAVLRWLRGPNNLSPRELALAGGVTDRGALALAEGPRLAALHELALTRGAIGPDGLAALLAAPLPRLRRLLLGRNLFGEPGARALADSPTPRALDLLDLDCDRLRGPAVAAIARAPLLAGVRALNLSNNPIGAAGCAALADSPHLGRLEVLRLHGCDLDDDAAAELLRAPWLAGLKDLSLSANALSLAAVAAVADRPALALDELDICHNHFDPQVAGARLRAAPQLARLRRLCV